ncbi:putative tRNA pseudouridine synthase Pus10 [Neolamprologus brichardi]|uniref:putative tRNA pseudouridine synthase Pus10 n=1 Tax=Neolamprologus brichardi TaxID=32507 RepID=UPI001643BFF0|nr:putative tRNA pseudouridine synthase Pus10 [Neolamprologus brichardi]
MLPLKEKDKPIIQKLLSAGCCARCVLRFCCVSVQAAYRKQPEETLKELQIFINDTENDKCQDSVALDSRDDYKSKDAAESETSEDPPNKRAKLETSISDVQSEEEAAAVFSLDVHLYLLLMLKICALFMTISFKILQHSCWLYVKKEVREKGLVLNKDDVIQVKEAFKWIMQGMVTKELGGIAVVTKVSPFEVSVEFTHSETDADCHFLAATCPDCFKPTKNKQNRLFYWVHWFNLAGRPFAMELLNPHKSRFSKEQMKQLQETINQSSDKIKVRDLQIVTR